MTSVIPFYLYGTARVGEPLWPWLKPICELTTLAMAPGTQLMVRGEHAAFPYLVSRRPNDEPWTWGDLVLLQRGEELTEFVQMELAVGYTLEGIPVDHDVPDLPPFALAFIWRGDTAGMVPLGVSSWLSRSSSRVPVPYS